MQKEDERLRALLRRENQQRRIKERHQAKGLSASFLEPDRYEDDGEDLEQSLLAIKKKYKKKLAEGKAQEIDVIKLCNQGRLLVKKTKHFNMINPSLWLIQIVAALLTKLCG